MSRPPNKRFLTRKEVFEIYGIPVATLACWARDGKGIPYSRPGKRCLYDVEDIEAFIQRHRVEPIRPLNGQQPDQQPRLQNRRRGRPTKAEQIAARKAG